MTKDEALKLALEALEFNSTDDEGSWKTNQEAITAIKKALQSNEQVEPVAWLWKYSDGDEEVTFLDPQYFSQEALGIASTIPLYTHPPVPTAQPNHIPDATKMVAQQSNEQVEPDYKAIGQQAYESGYSTGYMDCAVKMKAHPPVPTAQPEKG